MRRPQNTIGLLILRLRVAHVEGGAQRLSRACSMYGGMWLGRKPMAVSGLFVSLDVARIRCECAVGRRGGSGDRPCTRCACMLTAHLCPPLSQVPSAEYSFDALEAAAVVPGRVQRLPRGAFRHEAQKQSLAFADIKKGGGAPQWYTSVADNHGVPTADLQLIHDALAGSSFESKVISNAFVGAVVDHRHRFVFRRTSGGAWLLPLSHMSESSALVWPMVGRSMPSYPDSLYSRRRST